MISQQDLSALMKREFATTLKIMHAYPAGSPDYTPHERSATAKQLMRTFVIELDMMDTACGYPHDSAAFKTYHPSVEEAIADFERRSAEVLEHIAALDPALYEKVIPFGPMEMPAGQLAFTMLLDQIHHRGQLSTYIRPSGGRVPSIYGPSADDPTMSA